MDVRKNKTQTKKIGILLVFFFIIISLCMIYVYVVVNRNIYGEFKIPKIIVEAYHFIKNLKK